MVLHSKTFSTCSWEGKSSYTCTTRPSFLEHELIDLPPPSSTASPTREERKSKKKSGGLDVPTEVAVSTEDPQEFPSKYSDLSYESQELDKQLFHTLLTIVKGTFLMQNKYGHIAAEDVGLDT